MNFRALSGAVLACLLAAALPGLTPAQSNFTAGNIVIYQVGDGSTTLVGTGNVAILKEFTTGGAASGFQLAFPSTGTGVKLIASGTATSEGMLTLGNNGQTLGATGYNTTFPTTGLAGTSAATVNRTVALIDGQGTATYTTLSDYADANNPRSAFTTDGTNFYAVGGNGGVRYGQVGQTTSTPLTTGTGQLNFRNVIVTGGQLYVSSGSNPTRIAAVGEGTPTSGTEVATNLPGIDNTTAPSPYQFFLARVGNPTFDGPNVLYFADDSANQIKKFAFDGTIWNAAGTVAASGARGLTGLITADNQISLFVVTGSSNNPLSTITDGSGAGTLSGSLTTLVANSGANTAFRGVAFAPARLVWAGGTGTWDVNTTANWTNTSVTGTPASRYLNAYAANFGDIGTNTAVTVEPGVHPQAVNVTNAANTYTFTNSGGSTGIQGLAALTKTGAGTLVLASPNTYSGGTFVGGGTLVAGNTSGAGSATGVGSVTVASGATLAGAGRIAPLAGNFVVVQPGGTLAPGPLASGAGVLTVAGGDTLVGTDANFRVRIVGGSPGTNGSSTGPAFPAQTTNTGLDVTAGTLEFLDGANVVIDGTGMTFALNQQYSYVVGRAPDAAALTVGALTAGDFSTIGFGATGFSLVKSGNLVILNFTPVPEPATVLGAAAAGLGLARLVRRRLRR